MTWLCAERTYGRSVCGFGTRGQTPGGAETAVRKERAAETTSVVRAQTMKNGKLQPFFLCKHQSEQNLVTRGTPPPTPTFQSQSHGEFERK